MSDIPFRPFYEIVAVLGVVITLAGVWLRSRLPSLESMAEEAVKNRKLTPEQERMWDRIFQYGSAALTLVGLFMLILAVVSLGDFM